MDDDKWSHPWREEGGGWSLGSKKGEESCRMFFSPSFDPVGIYIVVDSYSTRWWIYSLGGFTGLDYG